MTDCCAADWRLELLDIRTGNRVGYLPPLSFDFEEKLNEVGTGSVTLSVHSVTPDQVWPNHRMIAFVRIAGPGASPLDPICEFIGIIQQTEGSSDGTMTIGVKSIESYFEKRLITEKREYVSEGQNHIGANLVNEELGLTTFEVPIKASGSGGTNRTRTYRERDYKVLLEAIQELTKIRNGPDYTIRYFPTDTGWRAVIRFLDRVGSSEDDKVLDSRRGLSSYSVSVDATNHINSVHAIGAAGSLGMTYNASDDLSDGLYPRLMRSEQYSDLKNVINVQNYAEGSLDNDLHPRAQPSVTVGDLELGAPINVGDRVHLHLAQGALRFKGDSRVVGKAWSVSASSPTQVTFSFLPNGSSVNAVLQAPDDDDGCC